MITPVRKMASDVSVCSRCSDNFIVNSKSIVCGLCKNKFHSACVSLRDEICKIVPKVANIYWFCDNCETIVNKNLPKLNAVPDSTHVDIRLCEKEIECLKREDTN